MQDSRADLAAVTERLARRRAELHGLTGVAPVTPPRDEGAYRAGTPCSVFSDADVGAGVGAERTTGRRAEARAVLAIARAELEATDVALARLRREVATEERRVAELRVEAAEAVSARTAATLTRDRRGSAGARRPPS